MKFSSFRSFNFSPSVFLFFFWIIMDSFYKSVSFLSQIQFLCIFPVWDNSFLFFLFLSLYTLREGGGRACAADSMGRERERILVRFCVVSLEPHAGLDVTNSDYDLNQVSHPGFLIPLLFYLPDYFFQLSVVKLVLQITSHISIFKSYRIFCFPIVLVAISKSTEIVYSLSY